MQDILSLMQTLRRPRLLVRAARIGADEYRREPHLGRILGVAPPARHAPAILKLMEIEAVLDERRRASDGGYSAARHVEVLAAMMGEARQLRAHA
ncbi:DUF6477 family protein [Salipiger abyssi]|uniref:DUF6477 family protein n=1 Tax=Salipiger abyssi TaxID=1250539 RepID=UPI001A8E1DB6|nr:DUF6477 family protein [Salipiger abyssi]MBN9886505.1 hypothetical protein [Salipiger abyssi]